MSKRITVTSQSFCGSIRQVLVKTAYQMLRQHKRRETFCTYHYFVTVETDFGMAISEGAAGIQFYALVQMEEGLVEFSFLVRGEEALRCRRIYYSNPGCN